MPVNRAKLLSAAKNAAKNSYSPYSGIKVGAAVYAGGKIFSAANVENASYGLTACAERNAVASAVSSGNRKIEAVALFISGKHEPVPCGACLQVLQEFAKGDIPVISASGNGEIRISRLSSFLPKP
ncbi:MAG: cytidine deaminase, partial [Elusimicrobia bacterium RIFOXYA1_FULL_47_7]